jgi:hypothetical protein
MKINLQTYQFRFKDRRNELTNKAVQFKTYANAVANELTHRLVHLSPDKRGIDKLTHRSAHELQITGVQMNLLTGRFIDYKPPL